MSKYVRTTNGKIYKVIHTNSFGPAKYVCEGNQYDITVRFGGEKKNVSGHSVVFISEKIVEEVFEKDEDNKGTT